MSTHDGSLRGSITSGTIHFQHTIERMASAPPLCREDANGRLWAPYQPAFQAEAYFDRDLPVLVCPSSRWAEMSLTSIQSKWRNFLDAKAGAQRAGPRILPLNPFGENASADFPPVGNREPLETKILAWKFLRDQKSFHF